MELPNLSNQGLNLQERNSLLLALGENDPIFFAEYFLGLQLTGFQARYLRASVKEKELLLITSNQCGKTVGLAVEHIWTNFYKKGLTGNPELIEKIYYQTLNISPISRQAKEAFRYVDEILHSSFGWEEEGRRQVNNCLIEWFWAGKNETLGRIDFSNNSALFCLSTGEDQGAGLQGAQFGLITYDECNQSHHLQEELPARVFSRCSKLSAPIHLCGTPDEMAKSQQYWFHLHNEAKNHLAKGTKGTWFLIEGIYDENRFIPEKTREEYKKRLFNISPTRYDQVILGKFVASERRMFPPETVEGMWNGKREPSVSKPDRQYAISVDWGVAEGGDETVMLVADVTEPLNAEIVNHYSRTGGDPVELMAMVSFLRQEYNDADCILDTASMGGEMFRKMLSALKPISFGIEHKTNALIYTQMRLRNNVRKDISLTELSSAGKIKSYYLPKLEEQLSSYRVEDSKIQQDWVMALIQLVWYLDKYKKQSVIEAYPLRLY